MKKYEKMVLIILLWLSIGVMICGILLASNQNSTESDKALKVSFPHLLTVGALPTDWNRSVGTAAYVINYQQPTGNKETFLLTISVEGRASMQQVISH